MKEKRLKPLFKWSGGKRRELHHVDELKPDRFDKFCEPFVGGGAVWLNLEHRSNIVNDVNTDVINFYKMAKEHGADFIDDLNAIACEYKRLIESISPKDREDFAPLAEIYYHWRDGKHSTNYELAKRFYVLRCLAFGGMLRYNASGKFNVPYGYYKTFKEIEWNDKYEKTFQNTDFFNEDWKQAVSRVKQDDFVFLDPPYTRKFTKYDPKKDFGAEHHEELAKWFSERHSKAMIILNKDDFTESLYEGFIAKEYDFSYSVRYRKDRLTKEGATTKHFVAINY
jgi:DNA adenine methylase